MLVQGLPPAIQLFIIEAQTCAHGPAPRAFGPELALPGGVVHDRQESNHRAVPGQQLCSAVNRLRIANVAPQVHADRHRQGIPNPVEGLQHCLCAAIPADRLGSLADRDAQVRADDTVCDGVSGEVLQRIRKRDPDTASGRLEARQGVGVQVGESGPQLQRPEVVPECCARRLGFNGTDAAVVDGDPPRYVGVPHVGGCGDHADGAQADHAVGQSDWRRKLEWGAERRVASRWSRPAGAATRLANG